jgi:hypothetical protein
MRWKVRAFHDLFDDVSCSFRAGTKERGAFTPAHLQTVWDYKFNVILSNVILERWEDIGKVPGIIIRHSHSPEPIFYIQFAKHEGSICIKIISHRCDNTFQTISKLCHGFRFCQSICCIVNRGVGFSSFIQSE